MYGHCIAFQIYIQHALFYRRKEHFAVFLGVDDKDIICSCLHDIFECPEFCSVF